MTRHPDGRRSLHSRALQAAVVKLSRRRPLRALFVGVYKALLLLFVGLCPDKAATKAMYLKINWRDCWPGSSDLDVRIILKDLGDPQEQFRVFRRQISFVRSFRRVWPMFNHIYVMSESHAAQYVARGLTNAFGQHVNVWRRVWGDTIPECETTTTPRRHISSLRDALIQWSTQVLPWFFNERVEERAFSRRIYTSLINVLRHCLYFRGEAESTTGTYQQSLEEIMQSPTLNACSYLPRLLRDLQKAAQNDFYAAFDADVVAGALLELIAYLDVVSAEAMRSFQYDSFTLSSVDADDDCPGDRESRRRVGTGLNGFGALFDNWIVSRNGLLPGNQAIALVRQELTAGEEAREMLVGLREVRLKQRSPGGGDLSPLIVSENTFRLYLALNPHLYFYLRKYYARTAHLKGIELDGYGTSREVLIQSLLRHMNLLSTAFRDDNVVSFIHLFVGVLPMAHLFFETGKVCASLGECAHEYAGAGLGFSDRVDELYALDVARKRSRRSYTSSEAARILDGYGPQAVGLMDAAIQRMRRAGATTEVVAGAARGSTGAP